MFDLPDAKRVRRSDIYPSPSHSTHDSNSSSNDEDESGESEPNIQAQVHARIVELYGDIYLGVLPSEHARPLRAIPGAESKIQSKKSQIKGSKTEEGEEEENGDGSASSSLRKREGDASSPAIEQEEEGGRPQEDTAIPEEGEQEQEFEFRLFSAPSHPTTTSTSTPTPQIQKIILTPSDSDPYDPSSTHTAESGAFLRNTKDPRTFVVGKAVGETLERYRAMAVEVEDVLRESGRRNWGLEVGWRVLVLKGPSAAGKRVRVGGVEKGGLGRKRVGSDGDGGNAVEEGRRKIKPNKKRRIILRERAKKEEVEKERKIKEALLKGENEREKRTRRNREKKVKRKAKLKAVGIVKMGEGDGKEEAPEGKAEQKMDVD